MNYRLIPSIGILLSTALITFSLQSIWYFAVVDVLVGGAWLWSLWKKPSPFPFLFFIFFSVLSVIEGSPPWLAGSGIILALLTWDVEHFLQKLSQYKEIELRADMLVLRHFFRLGIVLGIGILLAVFMTQIQLDLGFWIMAFLATVMLFGVSMLLRYLIREKA